MVVRQGVNHLRDLHEDATGPGQGKKGDFPLQQCLAKSNVVHYDSQNNHNSLVCVDVSLCDDRVSK